MYFNVNSIHDSRSGNCVFCLGGPGVNKLSTMLHHLLDHSLLLEFIKGFACQGSADLETLRHDSRCNQLVSWDFLWNEKKGQRLGKIHIKQDLLGTNLKKFVICGLIEKDKVVQLVTGLSFGPLLLFGLSTTSFLLFGWGRFRRCLRRLGILFGSLEFG